MFSLSFFTMFIAMFRNNALPDTSRKHEEGAWFLSELQTFAETPSARTKNRQKFMNCAQAFVQHPWFHQLLHELVSTERVYESSPLATKFLLVCGEYNKPYSKAACKKIKKTMEKFVQSERPT